jgi:hypothetical protein
MPDFTVIVLTAVPDELRRCLAAHVSGNQSVNFYPTDMQRKEDAHVDIIHNQSVNLCCAHAQV